MPKLLSTQALFLCETLDSEGAIPTQENGNNSQLNQDMKMFAFLQNN